MAPSINPAQMRKMMQRMGIQQSEIDASAVIIKTPDKDIIITEPSVTKVNMMGQETYQVVGTPEERPIDTKPDINSEDIKTVMEQAHVDEAKAREAIEKSGGDLAEAIISLKGD